MSQSERQKLWMDRIARVLAELKKDDEPFADKAPAMAQPAVSKESAPRG